MKIVAQIHGYPPIHNAGGEYYVKNLFEKLVCDGYDCHVVTEARERYELNGVKVYPQVYRIEDEVLKGCDLIISHLARSGRALNTAVYYKKKIAIIFHSTLTNYYLRNKQMFIECIYNSDQTEAGMKLKPGVVLHPICTVPERKTKGKYVTLINCNENKGGRELVKFAEALPNIQFMGILGDYGEQVKADLPNLVYRNSTSDKSELYKDVSMLICPSKYESYSMTAVEAAMLNIPVIVSEAQGFDESLGTGRLAIPVKNTFNWIETIFNLVNGKTEYIYNPAWIYERQENEYSNFKTWLNKIV